MSGLANTDDAADLNDLGNLLDTTQRENSDTDDIDNKNTDGDTSEDENTEDEDDDDEVEVFSTPFPLFRDNEPLFIEYTSFEIWASDPDDEEKLDVIKALIPRLITANSPPLITEDSEAAPSQPLVAQTAPPGDFSLFGKLPIEIRLNIWRMTMNSRMIQFKPGGAKVPGAVNVCRESRAELRKRYQLRIALEIDQYYRPIPAYGIFVNWELDVVNIGPALDYANSERRAREYGVRKALGALYKIYHEHESWALLAQRMALDLENTNREVVSRHRNGHGGDWEEVLYQIRGTFQNIKELMVIVDSEYVAEYDQLVSARGLTKSEAKWIKVFHNERKDPINGRLTPRGCKIRVVRNVPTENTPLREIDQKWPGFGWWDT